MRHLLIPLLCVGVSCSALDLIAPVREDEEPSLLRDGGGLVQPKQGAGARQSPLSCGEHTLSSGQSAVIESKNYPSRYPNNYNCLWTFSASDDSLFSFECDDFAIRKSRSCRGDFLRVVDNVSKPKFCGTSIQASDDMQGPIRIRFRTNRRGKARGFSCKVTAYSSSSTGSTDGTEGTEETTTTTTEGNAGGCRCGVRNTASRIVGGAPTTTHEYPWTVGLVGKSSSSPYCGGSIIADSWILTAAHCISSNTVSNTDIIIGEHNWSTSSETTVTERRTLAQVRVHPGYSSRTLDNDIALIKLSQPITFNSDNKIAPVCLPTPGNLYDNVQATVTGWGTLSSGGSQPATLYEVTVPTMSNAACKATGYSNSDITNNMLCAGVPQGGKDSCQGDSGGPMVSGQPNMEQIGVVSWGYGCAAPNFPGVYTRVTNYITWIEQQTAGSETCPRSA